MLDHVKAIAQLSADRAVSFGFAADIFGVTPHAVKDLTNRHMGEFVNDGAIEFGSIAFQKRGGRPATRGLNRRGLLLLGMMLRDSDVAKKPPETNDIVSLVRGLSRPLGLLLDVI